MKEVKLKEILPSTAIHCKTEEEAVMLVNHAGLPIHHIFHWDIYKDKTCYYFSRMGWWTYGNVDEYRKVGYVITEFEDLIIDDEMEEEQVENENPDKPYITCTLVDGTVLDFDKRCEEIDEFGLNHDMIVFYVKNKTIGLNLSVIPKSQIKMINFVHTAEEFAELLKED